ncbi:hypothetical protein P154DRAFT_560231, partial [Amniculicola lignicola CBS 123094]
MGESLGSRVWRWWNKLNGWMEPPITSPVELPGWKEIKQDECPNPPTQTEAPMREEDGQDRQRLATCLRKVEKAIRIADQQFADLTMSKVGVYISAKVPDHLTDKEACAWLNDRIRRAKKELLGKEERIKAAVGGGRVSLGMNSIDITTTTVSKRTMQKVQFDEEDVELIIARLIEELNRPNCGLYIMPPPNLAELLTGTNPFPNN